MSRPSPPRIVASVLIFPCLALRWMASAVQSVAVTLFALAAVGGKLLGDLLLLLASMISVSLALARSVGGDGVGKT